MNRYWLYDLNTGEYEGTADTDAPDGVLPEGPHPGNSNLGVTHTEMVEGRDVFREGKVQKLPPEEVEARKTAARWREFRERRFKFFRRTDQEMAISDFPTDSERKNRLAQIRQVLRDAPENYASPEEALEYLKNVESDPPTASTT